MRNIYRDNPNFDDRAETYGLVFGQFESIFIAEYEKKRILEELSNRKGIKVLDIGCGWGRYAIEIVKNNSKVIGIDISKKMLKVGKKRLKNTSEIFFILSNANMLPFQNNIFDIVLCVRSLKWTAFNKRCLNEISRVLKKGGELIIYEERNKHTLQYIVHNILNKITNKYPLFPPYVSIFHLKKYLGKLGLSDFKIEGVYYVPHRFSAKINSYTVFITLTKIEGVLTKILPNALLACTYIFKCKKK